VGAVAIAETPVPGQIHLSPSVVGFWVEPSHRKRGIGAQLLAASCAHARAQGIGRLYAATAAASAVFLREGWTMIDAEEPGVKTNIFSKTTG